MTDTITMRAVPYGDRDTRLNGELYWPETSTESGSPRERGRDRALLLIHGGAGLDDHARDQARRYARLGYVVFACDMYGEGVAGDRARIVACATALRDDPALLVRRAMAGVQALSSCPEFGAEADGTDSVAITHRIAAIGFCFGGMTALALARSGADLAGTVSIHGSLATSAPAPPTAKSAVRAESAVRAKVLACHGAADPHVPMSDVVAFTDEMNGAGADWQLIVYGQAQHGFTHKHAAPGATPGVAYDRLADERSFAAVRSFLADAFASADNGSN